MALAVQTQVSDGSLITVQVGIDFIEQDDIQVYFDLGASPLVKGVDYAWTASKTITFSNAVPAGTTAFLLRQTQVDDMLNVFDGGAGFTRYTLDENFRQILLLAQEVREGVGLRGIFLPLDMHGYQIKNLGTGVLGTDAVNLAQVQALCNQVVSGYQAADANLQAQMTGNVPLEASAFSPISWHDQSIDNSVTIPAGKNAWSFGPRMSISPQAKVTVPSGSVWTIADGDEQEGSIDLSLYTPKAELASAGGSALVGYRGRTVYDKLSEFVSLEDFGTVDKTGATSCTAVMQAALATGAPVRLPAGTLKFTVTLPNGAIFRGAGRGKTIITPDAGYVQALIFSGRHGIRGYDFTADGKATSLAASQVGLLHGDGGWYDIHFENFDIKNSGYTGLVCVGGVDKANNTRSRFADVDAFLNYWQGIKQSESSCVDWENIKCYYNRGNHGFSFEPTTWPPGAAAIDDCNLTNIATFNNQGHGLYILPLIRSGTSFSSFGYSFGTDQYCRRISLKGLKSHNNGGSGFMAGGYDCNYQDIECWDNGSSDGYAGMVLAAYKTTVNNGNFTGNATYGFDAGGSTWCTVSNINSMYNAVGKSFCIGTNVGACAHCSFTNITSAMNGSNDTNTFQFLVAGWDGDGAVPYEQLGGGNTFTNINIGRNGNDYGMVLRRRDAYSQINGVYITGGTRDNAFVNQTDVSAGIHTIKNVVHDQSLLSSGAIIASAATLVIDDFNTNFNITGTTGITSLLTKSRNDNAGKFFSANITNPGSGYTSKPTVTISGGGGSGATATAEISRSGTLIALNIQNQGSGYTSAPTITFSGGGGTGAAATAVIGCINHTHRDITLIFEAATTIQVPGMNTSFTTQGGSTLSLRGRRNGQWLEVSRAL